MTTIICGAVDCRWNGDGYKCMKKTVHLSDCYIMTLHDGRQHFNRCSKYEMSEESKGLLKQFKVVARGTQ